MQVTVFAWQWNKKRKASQHRKWHGMGERYTKEAVKLEKKKRKRRKTRKAIVSLLLRCNCVAIACSRQTNNFSDWKKTKQNKQNRDVVCFDLAVLSVCWIEYTAWLRSSCHFAFQQPAELQRARLLALLSCTKPPSLVVGDAGEPGPSQAQRPSPSFQVEASNQSPSASGGPETWPWRPLCWVGAGPRNWPDPGWWAGGTLLGPGWPDERICC